VAAKERVEKGLKKGKVCFAMCKVINQVEALSEALGDSGQEGVLGGPLVRRIDPAAEVFWRQGR